MEQELKDLWKGLADQEFVKLPHANLIENMETQHQVMSKSIRKRDFREVLVAALLMPIFLMAGFVISAPLAKLGAFLMVPSLGFIIYKLRSVKKYKPTELSLSSLDYFQKLKGYYTMEMDLLKEVVYWYLLPMGICLALIFIGLSEGVGESARKIGFLAIVYLGIYFLNQRAVKKQFQPLLANIDKTIQDLEKEE